MIIEYLYNGLTKINPKYLKSDQLLYRGVVFENESHIQKYEKLKVGDELSSLSFTSTTSDAYVVMDVYVFEDKNIIFVIHQNQRNARNIAQFSSFESEKEFIYPPETKFVVREGIKDIYCSEEGDLSKCVNKGAKGYYLHFRTIKIEEENGVPSYELPTSFRIKT